MKTHVLVTGLALAIASSASAGTTLISLTYGDLSGNYTAANATSGTYEAHAVDLPGLLRSAGNASRLVGAIGSADFQPGFVTGADLANFVMSITVNHTANTGTGVGSFTATDADGDTITGNMSGTWSVQGTYLAFQGTLSNVFIHDNGTLDHTFNGSDSGLWDTNFTQPSPYEGAVVSLTENGSNFFGSNWVNAATGVTAQVTATVAVPLPAAAWTGMSVLGLGLIRRHRR